MTILADASIQFHYSGGDSNRAPKESYGGAKSSVIIPNGTKLFKDIQPPEKATGKTDYRVIYIAIDPSELGTGSQGAIWLTTNDLADVTYEIAVGDLNTVISKPIDETTAPSGLTFASAPDSEVTGLELPDVVGGDYFGICIKRIVAITTNTKFNAGPEIFVNYASA